LAGGTPRDHCRTPEVKASTCASGAGSDVAQGIALVLVRGDPSAMASGLVRDGVAVSTHARNALLRRRGVVPPWSRPGPAPVPRIRASGGYPRSTAVKAGPAVGGRIPWSGPLSSRWGVWG
jgi:hypothetical protein